MTFQVRLGITRRGMAGIGGNLKSGTAKTWRAGSRKSADQVNYLTLKKAILQLSLENSRIAVFFISLHHDLDFRVPYRES